MIKNIIFYKIIVLLLLPGLAIAQSDYEKDIEQYQRDYAEYQDKLAIFYAGRDEFEAKYGDDAWHDFTEGDDSSQVFVARSRQSDFIRRQRTWEQLIDQATEYGHSTSGLRGQKYANFKQDLLSLESLYSAIKNGPPNKPVVISKSDKFVEIFFILFPTLFFVLFVWSIIVAANRRQKESEKEREESQFKKHMREKAMGDVHIYGNNYGHIVFGDLIATNSFNTIKDSNIEVARALEGIGKHISGLEMGKENQSLITEIFHDLQEKIADGKSDLIGMAWRFLLEKCPSIKSLTDYVKIIEGLF